MAYEYILREQLYRNRNSDKGYMELLLDVIITGRSQSKSLHVHCKLKEKKGKLRNSQHINLD